MDWGDKQTDLPKGRKITKYYQEHKSIVAVNRRELLKG